MRLHGVFDVITKPNRVSYKKMKLLDYEVDLDDFSGMHIASN